MYILILTLYLFSYFVLSIIRIDEVIKSKTLKDVYKKINKNQIVPSLLLPLFCFIFVLYIFNHIVFEENFIISGWEQKGQVPWYVILLISFLTCSLSYLIELIKPLMYKRKSDVLNFYFFVITQVTMFLILAILSHQLINVKYEIIIFHEVKFVLVFIIGLILSTVVSSKVIELTLMIKDIKHFRTNVEANLLDNNLKDSGLGSLIGLIERTLFFISFVNINVMSIPVILAAKAVYRFSEHNNDRVDYYIVGSLLSVLLSIISYSIYVVLLQFY